MRFTLSTLGCKVNQCESAHILAGLKSLGWTEARPGERADLCIVNTCTVTARAAYQSRQMLRRGANAGAKCIALGCYAQVEPKTLMDIPGVVAALGTVEKLALAELLPGILDSREPLISGLAQVDGLAALDVDRFPGRTRGFLKVQDGCDAGCSYCIVPSARGRPRSVPPDEVKAGLKRLVASGPREVVLTGIHLGFWGRDLSPKSHLAGLLKTLLQTPGRYRIRLSSLEPTEVTDELLSLIERDERLCPHLHVPLQSGSKDVLAAMGRFYSPEFYRGVVAGAAARIPRVGMGADVMAGFPSEGQREFEETLALIEELPLTYLHVFPYSPRPGTPAFSIQAKVPDKIVKHRARLLRELDQRKRALFAEANLGKRVAVLVETTTKDGPGRGFAENYLPVLVPGAKPGELVDAEIVEVRGGVGIGRLSSGT